MKTEVNIVVCYRDVNKYDLIIHRDVFNNQLKHTGDSILDEQTVMDYLEVRGLIKHNNDHHITLHLDWVIPKNVLESSD